MSRELSLMPLGRAVARDDLAHIGDWVAVVFPFRVACLGCRSGGAGLHRDLAEGIAVDTRSRVAATALAGQVFRL